MKTCNWCGRSFKCDTSLDGVWYDNHLFCGEKCCHEYKEAENGSSAEMSARRIEDALARDQQERECARKRDPKNWTGEEWAEHLSKHPEDAFQCDWSKMTGTCCATLFSVQPHLAPKNINWQSRFSNDNVVTLLLKQPRFYCEFEKGFGKREFESRHVRLLLEKYPEWTDKVTLSVLSPGSWSRLLQVRPKLCCYCSCWDEIDTEHWSMLLAKRPQFASLCKSWEKFDACDWANLLSAQPGFVERCDLNKIDKSNGDYNVLIRTLVFCYFDGISGVTQDVDKAISIFELLCGKELSADWTFIREVEAALMKRLGLWIGEEMSWRRKCPSLVGLQDFVDGPFDKNRFYKLLGNGVDAYGETHETCWVQKFGSLNSKDRDKIAKSYAKASKCSMVSVEIDTNSLFIGKVGWFGASGWIIDHEYIKYFHKDTVKWDVTPHFLFRSVESTFSNILGDKIEYSACGVSQHQVRDFLMFVRRYILLSRKEGVRLIDGSLQKAKQQQKADGSINTSVVQEKRMCYKIVIPVVEFTKGWSRFESIVELKKAHDDTADIPSPNELSCSETGVRLDVAKDETLEVLDESESAICSFKVSEAKTVDNRVLNAHPQPKGSEAYYNVIAEVPFEVALFVMTNAPFDPKMLTLNLGETIKSKVADLVQYSRGEVLVSPTGNGGDCEDLSCSIDVAGGE